MKPKGRRSKAVAVVLIISVLVLGLFKICTPGSGGVREMWSRMFSARFFGLFGPQAGQVTGIIYSDEDPSMMMGERVVHEGESIGNVTVVNE